MSFGFGIWKTQNGFDSGSQNFLSGLRISIKGLLKYQLKLVFNSSYQILFASAQT